MSGTSATITGLTANTLYAVQVLATNAEGNSPWSPSGSGQTNTAGTTQGAPDVPQSLSATRGNEQVTLRWGAPASDGGESITHYEYEQDGSGTWTSTGGTATRYTVTGLTNGQTYMFRVRAVNSIGASGESNQATATPSEVTPPPPPPVNVAPLAVDDAAETAEDTPVTIAVLENDSDPNGDTLTVVEVSAPAHGTAVVVDAGAVEYTPEPDYHGTDRFTYVVGDGSGLTAQAVVEVTVLPVNDPPLAGDDAAETVEDTPAFIDVLGNDSDPDGDTLTVVEVSAPTHGTRG